MNVAGIDPGLSGALAIIGEQGVVFLDDLPVHRVSSGKAPRSELNLALLRAMLVSQDIDHVVIERIGARPGQGTVSMLRFGYAAGAVAGMVVGLLYPLTFVGPQRWQRAVGCGPSPEDARQRASQLFPGIAGQLSRKKDVHKADAILLAWFGSQVLGNPSRLDIS